MQNGTGNQRTVYDIAVIGGGIAGAAVAREARLRGLSVVLFEKNTFGSGTSSKSSKLIHGGLRYLEIAWKVLRAGNLSGFWKNLCFVYLALRETHILAKTWPHLIREIELLMPIYDGVGRPRAEIFFGTQFYGLLSALSGGKMSRALDSAEKVLALEPGLSRSGLVGGVLVYDHTTDDLALVRQMIADARERGAQTFEKSEVRQYRYEPLPNQFDIEVQTPSGVKKFKAKRVINASGAWADQVRQKAGGVKSSLIEPVAGAHVEVPKFSNFSLILQATDNRIFFMLNRGDRARIGTTERLHDDPDHVEATQEEISYLLNSVKSFFPQIVLDSKSILATDAGIRPLVKPARAVSANQISREHEFIFDPNGAVHMLGVKLTDHRRAACELLDKLAKLR